MLRYNYLPMLLRSLVKRCHQFNHENVAIYNFVHFLLNYPDVNNRAQYILLSGVMLNNKDLMKYACETDPTVINKIVPTYIINNINAIFL